MLTRKEIDELLAVTAYDLGRPESWEEMGMGEAKCGDCGRWLQIVRPGKYQCECEQDPPEFYAWRGTLQTARQLAEWLEHCDEFYNLSNSGCDICQDITTWLEGRS